MSLSTKKEMSTATTSLISPYMSRRYSNRSQSSDGQKHRGPKAAHNRLLLLNKNVPTVPSTPPVCNKRSEMNLVNLRDILRASHQGQDRIPLNMKQSSKINSKKLTNGLNSNLSSKNNSFSLSKLRPTSQASLNEILKLADVNDIERGLNSNRSDQNDKITKIERDLQESLRILKQYNENSIKQTLMSSRIEERPSLSLARKNLLSPKEPARNESAKQDSTARLPKRNEVQRTDTNLNQIVKSNEKATNITQVNIEVNQTLEKLAKAKANNTMNTSSLISSSSESISNEDIISPKLVAAKKRTNEFLNELTADGCTNNTKVDVTTNSNYWNYDELNDLRMRFISLLSPDDKDKKSSHNAQEPTKAPAVVNTNKAETKINTQILMEEPMRKSTTKPIAHIQKSLDPITPEEQDKIESFYSSYGTSLYTAGSCACLYTMTNLKTTTTQSNLDYSHRIVKPSNPNRASMAIGSTNLAMKNATKKAGEIDHEILKDFMNNKYQNHVSVYHRGVPLWLSNSGTNPRRPSKQVKFTLAEKGTGFILWQDRIDACSDFKIYAQRKKDHKIVNYSTYCDKLEVTESSPLFNLSRNNANKSTDLFSAILITFRASDKKTTVFVKFDMNQEAAKFFDYYARISCKLSQEVKQRTKSLPAGVNINITNKGFTTSNNPANYDNLNNVVKRAKKPAANNNLTHMKRQSYLAQMINRQKRISKHEISMPSNLKHIIRLHPSDRNSYYTLSKLLPISVCSTLSISPDYGNESMTNSSNKSSPSPTYSTSSASSLSFSSSAAAKTMSRDIWDSKSNSKASNRSSSSSSLSVSPSFKLKRLESEQIGTVPNITSMPKRFDLTQTMRSAQKMAS